MSYLGNSIDNQQFTPTVDYFNGNGSTTSFTLSKVVGSVFDIQVVIENVPQNPASAFTIAGNVITFTSAPPSGTNNIYVRYTSPVTQLIKPSQGTVSNTEISSAFSLWNLSGSAINYTAGNVGIGNTSPTSKLTVAGAIESLVDQQGGSAEGGQLVLRAPVGGTKRWNVDNYQNQLRFFNENDSDASSGAVALTVTANGILSLAGASTAATGTGITFPSTQVASSDANTLDDYEEGTWTPSVGGNATYSNQVGRYTKIGNLVYIQGQIEISSLGTGSNSTLFGLPFTAVSGATEGGCNITYFAGMAVNVIQPVIGINSGTTNCVIYARTTAGTSTASVNVFGNGARLFFYGHYQVA
jgi:hypothetical protein